jgi:hypothetical protein
MTIIEIDRLIQGSGVGQYPKVELIILSQWAIFMGFALSKVNNDPKQRQECGDRLRNEFENLFVGLNNGVAVATQTVVPRFWISPDGNDGAARAFFRQNWDTRLKRYTELYTSGRFARNDDRLIGVIDEAIRNIIPISEGGRKGFPIPYDIVKSGIQRFIDKEISQIGHLLGE